MDIYKWAEEHDADYMDPTTGYIYKVQEHNRMKKFFGIDSDIKVVDSMTGQLIGYARKN